MNIFKKVKRTWLDNDTVCIKYAHGVIWDVFWGPHLKYSISTYDILSFLEQSYCFSVGISYSR